MGRVGEPPQAGYQSPVINRPNSFNSEGPVKLAVDDSVAFKVVPGDGVKDFNANVNQVDLVPAITLNETLAGDEESYGTFDKGALRLNTGRTPTDNIFGGNAFFKETTGQTDGEWEPFAVTSDFTNCLGVVTDKSELGDTANAGDVLRFGICRPYVSNSATLFNQSGVLFANGSENETHLSSTTFLPTKANGAFVIMGRAVGGGDGRQCFIKPTHTPWYILDFINPSARVCAYSTRRLSRSAPYAFLAYRNDDPSDTQDIGWTADGLADESAIVAFGNGANVRIATWYDQSGKGQHMLRQVAVGASSGPEVYDGTDLIKTMGVLSPKFDGAQTMERNFGSLLSQSYTVSMAFKNADVTGTKVFFDAYTGINRVFMNRTITQYNVSAGAIPSVALTPTATTNNESFMIQFNGSDSDVFKNGSSVDTNEDFGSNDWALLQIGALNTQANFYTGNIAEFMINTNASDPTESASWQQSYYNGLSSFITFP